MRTSTRLGAALVALTALLAAAAPAQAQTTAAMSYAAELLRQPAGKPWELGLTVGAQLATPDGSPPAALSRIEISFPRARVNDDAFPACDASEFMRVGARACRPASRLGTGTAAVDTRPLLGTLPARLELFNGPRAGGARTLLLMATVREPQVGIPMRGVLRRASGRFGYRLSLDIPKIHVLDTVRDPSIAAFSIEVNAYGRGRTSFIEAPRSCPRGGLPFFTTLRFHAGAPSISQASVIPCVLRSQPVRGR